MPEIKGYRELSAKEIELINKIKDHAEETRKLIELVVDNDRTDDITLDLRWLNTARTDLQKGYMALTRAIAKPTTF